ncbi:hypothetical protein BKA62DRAFT_732830 [Auriculariales sp. MPI-PUGE-AT-0066]|nr:hypothetical protein BKA62DRAFT_732830 [Auriculariales sp. MPI-PUGE-AT-0066]
MRVVCALNHHGTDYRFVSEGAHDHIVSALVFRMNRHHAFHCGCGSIAFDLLPRKVDAHWPFPDLTGGDVSGGSFDVKGERLAADCLISELDLKPCASIHLVFDVAEGSKRTLPFEPPPPNFALAEANYRMAMIVEGPSPETVLAPKFRSSKDDQAFASALTVPGTLISDKSGWALFHSLHVEKGPENSVTAVYHNIVLRRPSGFGKSMLLAMLQEYLCGTTAPEFFPGAPHHFIWEEFNSFEGAHFTAVVDLDLSEIKLEFSGSLEDMTRTCRTFLEQEVERMSKMHPWNNVDDEKTFPCQTLNDLMSRLDQQQERNIAILVDNYTTPLIGLSGQQREAVERTVYVEIIQPLLDLIDSGRVIRSYFFGADFDVEQRLPFIQYRRFAATTKDITELDMTDGALGLTPDDIRILWKRGFPKRTEVDPMSLVDATADDDLQRTYSCREVLQLFETIAKEPDSAPVPVLKNDTALPFIRLWPDYSFIKDGQCRQLARNQDVDRVDPEDDPEPSIPFEARHDGNVFDTNRTGQSNLDQEASLNSLPGDIEGYKRWPHGRDRSAETLVDQPAANISESLKKPRLFGGSQYMVHDLLPQRDNFKSLRGTRSLSLPPLVSVQSFDCPLSEFRARSVSPCPSVSN